MERLMYRDYGDETEYDLDDDEEFYLDPDYWNDYASDEDVDFDFDSFDDEGEDEEDALVAATI
jgi:hypothetical protein